ncbi:hypothetical protein BC940DRAFT_267047 [Gongronella butleri]|nr:hypothetical protein BC940DRAFT_267047 [Gongronella butleri]
MLGSDSYHVECFRCTNCLTPIEDLVYKQTSKGLLCVTCNQQWKMMKNELVHRPLPSLPEAKHEAAPVKDDVLVTQGLDDELRSEKKAAAVAASHSSASLSSASSSVYTCSQSSPSSSQSNLDMLGLSSPYNNSSLAHRPTATNAQSATTTTTTTSQHAPSLSSSTSLKSLDLPAIPSLNLSFFDEESDEMSNLTLSLGAGLAGDASRSSIGKSKIKRASEYLQASLDNLPAAAAVDEIEIPPLPSSASSKDTIEQLKLQLDEIKGKWKQSEDNYATLKTASQKALEEFGKAKEEFAKEVDTRQQHEFTILQLRNQLAALQSNNQAQDNTLAMDIDRLASVKVELVRTCNQLKQYRNAIAQKMEAQIHQSQAGLGDGETHNALLGDQHRVLEEQIRSLQAERDDLLTETEQLTKNRDEIIHEMVVLNTKNAELSSMNNDLSRRVTERERETAALMASTSFIHQTPSPSQSTDRLATSPKGRKSSEASLLMQRLTSRDSNSSRESSTSSSTNKLFKLKKANHMLNKISSYYGPKKGGTSGSGGSDTASLYGHSNHSLYSLNMSSTLNVFGEMKRKNSNPQDGSLSPGRHQFVQTSLLRPVKCSACGEKVWGASDYRCQGCGCVAHGRCLHRLPVLCFAANSHAELIQSPTNDAEKLFGESLAVRIAFEDRAVPLLVEQCIQAVEVRGMDYEGIYRKSGGAAQMRTVQLAFETNEPLDLQSDDEINDICAVTSVLKQYFRELPNPLLTYELYDNWLDAVRLPNNDAKLDRFAELVSQLPKANYDTLKMLISHLQSVSKQHEVNLMTVKNLAMVFGPTLMRDREAARDLVDMSSKNAVIEYHITHFSSLFTD